VALGLPYLMSAFGPTEAEVRVWGWLCLALVCAAIGMLQVPAALLWFLFHGSGISDGSPPSAFVAHWAYALPHLALLALSVLAAARLLGWLRPAGRSWLGLS
jgi:hypothetical protein